MDTFHNVYVLEVICFVLLTFMGGVWYLVCWLYMQWVPKRSLLPQRSSTSLLTHATYSCDSQLVFAGFLDGCVGIFDAKNLEPCCWLAPSVYIPQGVQRYVPMLDQNIGKCMASIHNVNKDMKETTEVVSKL